MTTTVENENRTAAPLVRLTNAGKHYGTIIALSDITLEVGAGEVTCVLGDNGAGKSTLIKIIAGLHQPSEGTYEVEGEQVSFSSPREALERGIATVYQDLAVVPLMPVWRNFFLGNEKRKKGLRLDIPFMRKTCKEEMLAMGIDLRDVEQPIGTLSGGERQCVAISRAVYFGAKVLILDEPTAALGVKQSGIVLKYVIQARERGLGVIFITHNPHHAYPVGDRFLLLNRGRSIGYYEKEPGHPGRADRADGGRQRTGAAQPRTGGGRRIRRRRGGHDGRGGGRTRHRDPRAQHGGSRAAHGQPAGMTRRVRIGLAGLGRMGRIHAASLSGRCPARPSAPMRATSSTPSNGRTGDHAGPSRTPFEVLTMGRIGVDIYPLQIGRSLRHVESFGKYLGGSATNVAVAAARYGRRAAVISRTGQDPFGDYIHDALKGFRVDDRFVTAVPSLPTPVTFCEIFPPDDFPLYFYRFPTAPDLQIEPNELDTDAIDGAGIFWMTGTGLCQEPSRSATLRALAGRARGRPAGPTVFDLDYRGMFWPSREEARRWYREALPHATVAVGNLDECDTAVGVREPRAAARALHDAGIQLAIIKQGPAGVLASDGTKIVEVPPVPVEVVNGLGAGDAFGGALCHSLLSGWDLERTLRFCNAAGAVVASRLACADAMPTADEVEAIMQEASLANRGTQSA